MEDMGRNGAWIGVGLVAASAIYTTGNPWFALILFAALIAY